MKVKIKTWKQMADEYWVDSDGAIPCGNNYFTKTMEEMMPTDRVIEVHNCRTKDNYKITDEMIEEFVDEKVNNINLKVLDSGIMHITISKPINNVDKVAEIIYNFSKSLDYPLYFMEGVFIYFGAYMGKLEKVDNPLQVKNILKRINDV